MQEKREKKRFFMKALRCNSDSSVLSNRETNDQVQIRTGKSQIKYDCVKNCKKEWLPDILPFSGLQED